MKRFLLGIVALAATFWPGAASALDPGRSLQQFKHRRWTLEDHAPSGIRSITQAADGYLLLGASDGVYRFDGVSFELLPRPGKALRNDEVVSLLPRRSGEVWVNYDSGPAGVYRDGTLTDLGGERPLGVAVEAAEDGAGDVWFGLYSGLANLARYSNARWQAIGAESGLNAEPVYEIVPSKEGVTWVLTAHTLQYLRKGETQFQPTGEFFPRGAALTADEKGGIWISDNYRGTRRLPDYLHGAGAPARPTGPLPVVEQAVRHIIVDRDGAVWGATQSRGIFRVAKPDPGGEATAVKDEEVFGFKEGLTSDIAHTVYEDREGNIWVGTTMGLDQFRASNVVTEPSVPPRSYFGYALVNGADGRLYVMDASTLYVVAGDAAPKVLASGFVHPETVCESQDGSIYLTMKDDMVRLTGGAVTHVKLPPDHVDFEGCVEDERDGFWFTLGNAGAAHLGEKGWSLYPLPADRLEAWAGPLKSTPDGVIAYFYTRGLIRIDVEPTKLVASEAEIGIGQIAALYMNDGGLMAGGRYGLARVRGDRIERVTSEGRPWLESVQGIAQTKGGDTWLFGAKGLVRVQTRSLEAAFSDPRAPLAFDLFNMDDGVPGPLGAVGTSRDILAASPDGRIWLATTEGLAWLDPAHLSRNRLVPPVTIAGLIANGKRYPNPHELKLQAGVADLEIHYTALSLSIPDRVRFRYRLDGVDRDWVDAGSRRQAFYTKLGPGSYRFHVMAANNDGVWNETGAMLSFTVPPTFVQSPLFLALCAFGMMLLLWALYTLRVRQVSLQMRRRLDERLAERERIARELHDTLLQGFQGLVLRFQAATESIPVSHDARRMMETALDQADSVIVEGRDRVKDLRSANSGGGLTDALSEAARRLAPDNIRTTIVQEGAARELLPWVFDEVLRIGEEAITNAVRHSGATAIDVELTYQSRHLRLSIRDNGIGIDPAIAHAGRAGHFGLVGMRERAHGIRGQFAIFSRPLAGAEVTLTVPAAIAYKTVGGSLMSRIRRTLSPAGRTK